MRDRLGPSTPRALGQFHPHVTDLQDSGVHVRVRAVCGDISGDAARMRAPVQEPWRIGLAEGEHDVQ